MTLSDLSVRRPVMAAVGAIAICVIGLAAFFALPIRELPNVDPPQVSIATNYRGASAEVVEERITERIESAVAGLEGIDRVTSNSRDGRSFVNITFLLSRDLESAANDVRDAVSRVVAQLPTEADPPTITKANADAQPIIFVQMASTTMNKLEMSDYANRYLIERLSTVPGVAQVSLQGAQLYSMRIWLDAKAMAARGVTVSDVDTALRSQNVELPAGTIESPNKDYTVRVNRQYVTPEDFQLLPITTAARTTATTTSGAATSNYVTRLGDVARVVEESAERRSIFRTNGQDTVGLGITRQSVANDLAISRDVRKAVDEINQTLPKGTALSIVVDNSIFTEAAIHEVWITMGLAIILVALVNYLFLGSWRSALIPSITAPICILSTFIVLAPLGFSINLLTLLALVLAIGLVVDDAIVVVENVQRRIDAGEPPLLAAERGSKQVYFAVIATTAVLISVFAPLMFLPGYIGRLFVELAVTVATAIFFSAILALSLAPMLSSKLLRPAKGEGFVARAVDNAMSQLRDSYRSSLQVILGDKRTGWVAGGLVAVLAVVAGWLYLTMPNELVPEEDRGMIQLMIQGPEGAGFDYTSKIVLSAEKYLAPLKEAGLASAYSVTAPQFGGFNSGNGNLILAPWGERSKSAQEIAADLNRQLSGITGARVIANTPAALSRGGGGGGGGGNQIQFIALGPDYGELQRWIEPIKRAAEANPNLGRPRLNYEPNSPRLIVDLDRDKAATLGVSAQSVGDALQTMFGSKRSTTYVKNGQEYDVIMQTQLEDRRNPEDLNNLYIRTGSGDLVPLAAAVNTRISGDAAVRQRVDRQRAIQLSAEMQPGYTLSEAIAFFKAEAAKQPPVAIVAWGGTAKDFLEASNSIGLAFGMALLLVFLVLAAQFESFVHPAVIMLTVPLAALGGLFGLLMSGSSINTYSQVGLIILVGIAAKNGILIVEFSNQLRDEGRGIRDAVIEASALRLRPIVMTSVAAAVVALPLAFSSGPGSGSRRTIGAVICSGAVFSTMLTLFVVPVFYNLLARFTKSPEANAKAIEEFELAEKNHGPPVLHPKAAE